MIDPGEESKAHEVLDSLIRGEKEVEGARRLLTNHVMDWDDTPWCDMEWEEAETLFPAPTIWEGEVYSTLSCRGEAVCLASICEGGVVCPDLFSGGEEVCPAPSCEGGVACPATTQRTNSRKRTADHSRDGRQVRNTPDSLYYKLCGWCTAKPKDHRQPSIQMCCAPTGTQCPDLSSYKAATEIWWQPEDAMLSNKGRVSSKKRKTPTFSLENQGR